MTLRLKDNATDIRTDMSLGTAATLDVGTGANQVVQLDGSGNLPAVGAANVTGLGGNTPPFFAKITGSYVSFAKDQDYMISSQMTEQLDTGGCFARGRFTPNVAGKYWIGGQCHIDGGSSNLIALYGMIKKNGSTNAHISFEINEASAYANEATGTASGIIDFNGTTDYVELYIRYSLNDSQTRFAIQDQNCFYGYRIA